MSGSSLHTWITHSRKRIHNPEIQSHMDDDVQASFFVGKNQLLLLYIVFPFYQPRLVHIGGIISCCNSSAFWMMLFLWGLGSPSRLMRLRRWPRYKQKSSVSPFGVTESETTSPSSPRKEQDEILRVGLILFPNKWHLEGHSLIGRLCLLFSIVLKKLARMGKGIYFISFARGFVRETCTHGYQAVQVTSQSAQAFPAGCLLI